MNDLNIQFDRNQLEFQKSSFSNTTGCVEWARVWLLRDSKNPDGPIMLFFEREMVALERAARRGEIVGRRSSGLVAAIRRFWRRIAG